MKKQITYYDSEGLATKTMNYLPVRYLVAIFLAILETALVITLVICLTIYVPYFYIAIILTEVFYLVKVVASNANPDYKIPWLLLILLIPVVGIMLYLLFHDRQLSKRQAKRLQTIKKIKKKGSNDILIKDLEQQDKLIASQAKALLNLTSGSLYTNTKAQYYPSGETTLMPLLNDLVAAKRYIFLEYFIIADGLFWQAILTILKDKVKKGVEVRVIYDDIGCMTTLSGSYYKELSKLDIKCQPFFKLNGQANNKFNNRSHRKMIIIDGEIAYTGGFNLADEYINKIVKFGYWKDAGLRLEGEAVKEFVYLFWQDWNLNSPQIDLDINSYLRNYSLPSTGYYIPFGDGPKPVYNYHVSQIAISNLLQQAQSYVYITTPYLIITDEILETICNTSLRGVKVVVITPHIPDKKFIHLLTRSNYKRLLVSGVKIYEYKAGFIHAKTYLADGKVGIIGTMNLDYRSLVHHFENGVWLYKSDALKELEMDLKKSVAEALEIKTHTLKFSLFQKCLIALGSFFAPLL